jgi:hypothetical protein
VLGLTCITKSTRPVELIALSLSASCLAVFKPDVLWLNTEYNVSSGIRPIPAVVESGCCGWGLSGETSVYPSDLEMREDVILELLSDNVSSGNTERWTRGWRRLWRCFDLLR